MPPPASVHRSAPFPQQHVHLVLRLTIPRSWQSGPLDAREAQGGPEFSHLIERLPHLEHCRRRDGRTLASLPCEYRPPARVAVGENRLGRDPSALAATVLLDECDLGDGHSAKACEVSRHLPELIGGDVIHPPRRLRRFGDGSASNFTRTGSSDRTQFAGGIVFNSRAIRIVANRPEAVWATMFHEACICVSWSCGLYY